MNATNAVDIPRLIRIATLLFTLLGGSIVYFAFAPSIDALQQRIDDGQATLRSDEVAFSEVPLVRAERDALARRYATLFGQNPEAVFLRELSSTVRRNGVALLSTTVTRDANGAKNESPSSSLLAPTLLQIELRGSYAHVLGAIADLSLGSEIVNVGAPSLRRDDDAVIASVPVVIYEPGSQEASTTDAGGRRR